jgi:hypothetical protein
MAAIGVIPKGMLPEVFQLHTTVKQAADTIEAQLNVVGETLSSSPGGLDLKVSIRLLKKQVEVLNTNHTRAKDLLGKLKKESEEPCSSCCSGCAGCCNCTTHVVKKRLFTVIEPANSVTGIVAIGASTFDDSCDKSVNPLKVVGFVSVVAGFFLNLAQKYLAEQIAANQLNISKLEILNEKMGRFIESTNSMIQVYERVDQYDGRPGGRRVKDDLQNAIPEAFRQYVTPDALQNYVQVRYNTLPPRGHSTPMGVKDLTSGMGSVRKSPFGSHSRRPSQDRALPELRPPEKGKLHTPTDKSSSGSNPGHPGTTQEDQTTAVFVPAPELPAQPELLLSPTHPPEVATDVKQQQVADKEKLIQGNPTGPDLSKPSTEAGSQPQGRVPESPSDSTHATLPAVMSDPQPPLQTQELRPEVRPDSKEGPLAGTGTGAIAIELPSQPTPVVPTGSSDGRKTRSLWNWMG